MLKKKQTKHLNVANIISTTVNKKRKIFLFPPRKTCRYLPIAENPLLGRTPHFPLISPWSDLFVRVTGGGGGGGGGLLQLLFLPFIFNIRVAATDKNGKNKTGRATTKKNSHTRPIKSYQPAVLRENGEKSPPPHNSQPPVKVSFVGANVSEMKNEATKTPETLAGRCFFLKLFFRFFLFFFAFLMHSCYLPEHSEKGGARIVEVRIFSNRCNLYRTPFPAPKRRMFWHGSSGFPAAVRDRCAISPTARPSTEPQNGVVFTGGKTRTALHPANPAAGCIYIWCWPTGGELRCKCRRNKTNKGE